MKHREIATPRAWARDIAERARQRLSKRMRSRAATTARPAADDGTEKDGRKPADLCTFEVL